MKTEIISPRKLGPVTALLLCASVVCLWASTSVPENTGKSVITKTTPTTGSKTVPVKTAETLVVKTISPNIPVDPIDALNTKLDNAFKSVIIDGPQPDLYAAAKARLYEVQLLLKEDPKSKEKNKWMESCNVLVNAALTQIQVIQLSAERSQLQAQRAVALSELNATQDEIARLERGVSSSLKADLEDQKRKAAAAKDEAEKRFGELNSALIQVHRDARGTIISMSDILFDVGKATLTNDLKINLAKIAGILTIYKDANVVVEGHTDNVGGEEYNQKLSEKRASNVMDYMVTPGGVDAKRLTSQGFGFTKPVADNATKEGRQKNRRVDLVILDKKP